MRIVSIAARTIRWSIASRGAARGRTERAAVVLEVRSDRGVVGLGEAAPLPGMSPDTLDDAEAAITAFAQRAPFEIADREAAYALAAASSGTGASDPAGATSRSASNLAEATSRTGASDHPATSSSTAATSSSTAATSSSTAATSSSTAATSSSTAATSTRAGASTSAASDLTGACHAEASPGASSFAAASPAARFAIETALLDALARDRGVPLSALLEAPAGGAPPRPHVGDFRHGGPGSIQPRTVPLAAVVDDPDAARRAFAAGIRCLKVKLTAGDDPGRAHAIANAVPGARLRIDANRSWPHAEVAARLAALADLPIDYVEEPCREAHLLLAEPLACRLALDESLVDLVPADLHAALCSQQLAALVLKPTLLGGLSVVLALAALARRAGVAAIVSHGLEGPVGTAACAELALALGGDHPVGLAAHAALDGWLVAVRQLAPDHVHAVAAGGLGFADLDLAGVVRAGPSQRTSSSRTPL